MKVFSVDSLEYFADLAENSPVKFRQMLTSGELANRPFALSKALEVAYRKLPEKVLVPLLIRMLHYKNRTARLIVLHVLSRYSSAADEEIDRLAHDSSDMVVQAVAKRISWERRVATYFTWVTLPTLYLFTWLVFYLYGTGDQQFVIFVIAAMINEGLRLLMLSGVLHGTKRLDL